MRDKRGQYPLHRAAAVGSAPMVALLLKARSPLNATDGAGYTALHHAVAEGHGDTAVALLRAGAEAGKKDNDGHLALELAPGSDVRFACLVRWALLTWHRFAGTLSASVRERGSSSRYGVKHEGVYFGASSKEEPTLRGW